MRWPATFILVCTILQYNSIALTFFNSNSSYLTIFPREATNQSDNQEEQSEKISKEIYKLLSEIKDPEVLAECLEKLPGGDAAVNSSVEEREVGEFCDRTQRILQDIGTRKLLSRVYNRLYLLYYNDGDFDSATIAAEKSLSIAEEADFLEMMARGEQNFAILNSVQGRYTTAIEHFLKSAEYYRELGNQSKLARVYGNMGVTFEQAGNIDEAYEYMQKELSMSRELGNEQLQASSMANIGAIHSEKGRADSALYYYETSLELAKKLEYDDLIITNLDNIGAYYTDKEDYETALSYLMSALEKAKETGYEYQEIYITDHLSKNYLAQGKIDSAKKYADAQLDLALDFEFLYDQQLAWLNLSEIYAELSEYDKAYEAHINYAEIKDSLLNRDRIRQLEDLREQYEAEQREQQIAMLTLQNETAEFRRNTFLAGGILLSLILLLLFNRQRVKSKKNRQLLEKEQEMAEMKSSFFSNISHEFRIPLTLISGPIEMMKNDIEDSKIKAQLDVMQQNANRLLTLINQLLDLSKLESGKLELSQEETDIITLVKGVTMTFQSLAEIKQIGLSVETDLTCLKFSVDHEKLETILINLVNNAFAYTPEGGKITVVLGVEKDDSGKDQCRIAVKDTGQGIPKQDLPSVFDRFYRGNGESVRQENGTGIGLALTKELVELHDGSIDVSSKEYAGTTFVVNLPMRHGEYHKLEPHESMLTEIPVLAEEETEKSKSANESKESQTDDESAPIVLLIEDNDEVMHYLQDILGDTYRVLMATDGEQGVESALEQIPDLIISDVMMPKMNGYRVADTLKQDEKTSHIPLILLTAKASQKDKMQGLKTHVDEYLTKPFRPEELKIRIQNLIESRRQLREKYKREYMMRPDEVSVNSLDDAFLIRVKDAVDEHIDNEDFTVEQLGKEVGMSRSQLHRKLTALIGQSATEFIRSYRLHRAKEMIGRVAGSISEISYAVGFGSPSYFSKCFRDEFGMSPTESRGNFLD